MPSAGLAAPAVVYLLADHLDASLAAGEDLLRSTLRWNTGDARFDTLNEQRREERQAIDTARTLEMVLVARVLKAREGAQELAKLESHFKVVARLFVGGTQVVADAAGELADPTTLAFDAGSGITGYLRARGLIAEEVAAPEEAAQLPVTEQFLVGGRMHLGALLDLIAMFLDTLENHYELYDQPQRSGAGRAMTATTGAAV